MVKLHIKPAAGLLIRDPLTGHRVPPEGKLVPENSYWVRRLQCGDVSLVEKVESNEQPEQPKPEKEKPEKEKPEKKDKKEKDEVNPAGNPTGKPKKIKEEQGE